MDPVCWTQWKALPKTFFGHNQGRNEGGKGGTIPWAPIRYGGAESLQGRRISAEAAESPNNVTSTFFNTANLLSNELRFHYGGAKLRLWGRWFDHGGAKLVFCPGRHLTSLRPWSQLNVFWRCIISNKLAHQEYKPQTKVVRKGGWGYPPLELDILQNYITCVAVTLARPLHVSKDGQRKEKGKTKQATLISDFHAHGSKSYKWLPCTWK